MKFINISELPKTRLELRWDPIDPRENNHGANWYCRYDLVLELDEYDGRREKYEDGELIETKEDLRVSLGGTFAERSRGPVYDDGIDTPYRDSAHIKWDAKKLGLRMFVVCGEKAMEIFVENTEE